MESKCTILLFLSVLAYVSAGLGLRTLLQRAGAASAAGNAKLGTKSTALQVINEFGDGPYLKGKTVVVTGGNSGIGVETVKALAYAGARVILCSRSVAAGEEAVRSEIKQPGLGKYFFADTSNIVVKQLDLASLSSIKSFADDFLANEDRLDLLVLNAGIMALPRREETSAGFEKQIGVNHFGHFFLTQLLRERMVETATADGSKPRIVVLSSIAHKFGSVMPSDLHYTHGRRYSGWEAYGQSKMANLLFARSLGEKLKGTGVTALSVHPGVIRTNLWRQSFVNKVAGRFVRDKSIPQGAATTVFACVAPEIILQDDKYRGAWLKDCAVGIPNTKGRDETGELGNQLWKATETQLSAALSNGRYDCALTKSSQDTTARTDNELPESSSDSQG